jgi:hypothetical protein
MRNSLFSAAIIAAALLVPSVARAEEAPRPSAIELCRAEVAAQAGVGIDQVRFDQIRTRTRLVRVDLDLWRDGQLQNVRCDVARDAGNLTIAAISPALGTATASVAAQ